MTIDLKPLHQVTRLRLKATLVVPQGKRFQPTGFPDLGPARYQFGDVENLLVESPQSMANRLEETIWDESGNELVDCLKGISYVRVTKGGKYLTSTIQESHRINSPYILEGNDKAFFETLKAELGALSDGPIDRQLLGKTLLKYDINSLLHGVFLAKKELAGGRLRIARAISAFIEAEGVSPARSGGVKNDHVNPKGEAKDGFGNVPFSREEFVAQSIVAYFSIDLAQLRGYALGDAVFELLALIALFKIRKFLDGDLRLRTACEFEVLGKPSASGVEGFELPTLKELESALPKAIEKVSKSKSFGGKNGVTEVAYSAK